MIQKLRRLKRINGENLGLPGWCSGKESSYQCRRHKRRRFSPWIRKSPSSRKWQPAPVFLPGTSHGQRSLVGYRPRGHKESDRTDCACVPACAHTHSEKLVSLLSCPLGPFRRDSYSFTVLCVLPERVYTFTNRTYTSYESHLRETEGVREVKYFD